MPLTAETLERGPGKAPLIRLVGELDTAGIPVAQKAIRAVLAAGPRALVFDLAGLTFLNSTGYGTLVAARKDVEKLGGACFFTNLSPAIRRVFDIMQALPTQHVFRSVAELDEYLASVQEKVADGDMEVP